MSKIKVLLIVPMLWQGGFERICAMTAQLLKSQVEITLVMFSGKEKFYDTLGIDLIDLQLGASTNRIDKIVTLIKRIKALKKIKREKKITISYSFGGTANIANVLSRGKDKKWIGIRGYDAFDSKLNLDITCLLSDKIVCCTKLMEADIKKKYPKRTTLTLYNPCDFESITALSQEKEIQFQWFFTEENQYIISVGRAHDVKGYWHLIKAFSLVHKKKSYTKLVILGDGDFSEYKQLAKTLLIEEAVLFTGMQKNPFAYLGKCHVYALTSITEGFPNSLVEAMVVGVPVIATNCKTGPAEMLCEDYQKVKDQSEIHYGEYGTLIPIVSPIKNLDKNVIEKEEVILADEIIKLLESKDRKERGEKGRIRARGFSKEAYKKLLLENLIT